jgi:hypothetical protein
VVLLKLTVFSYMLSVVAFEVIASNEYGEVSGICSCTHSQSRTVTALKRAGVLPSCERAQYLVADSQNKTYLLMLLQVLQRGISSWCGNMQMSPESARRFEGTGAHVLPLYFSGFAYQGVAPML